MTLRTRIARPDDVPAMVDMIEARRLRYQQFQPVFWAKAERSAEMSQMWFTHLVGAEDTDVLTLEEDGAVTGFAIILRTPVPPVCTGKSAVTLDDFCIVDEARWDDLGHALLDGVRSLASEREWAQLIVVSAELDEVRNAFLEQEGLSIASVWYTQPF